MMVLVTINQEFSGWRELNLSCSGLIIKVKLFSFSGSDYQTYYQNVLVENCTLPGRGELHFAKYNTGS